MCSFSTRFIIYWLLCDYFIQILLLCLHATTAVYPQAIMDLRQTSSLRRFGSQPGGHELILKHRNGRIFAVRVSGRHLVAYIADIYCLYLVDFQQPRYMIQRPRRLSTESIMKVQQRSSTMLTRPSRIYFHPFKRT
ncbi:hypothetical protein C8J57DRAFT_274417 [Mycena rebaudengoi]|nr:hypothetical protein C8J57DRAFT_274417 [Mycena rebaudengoi]